MSINLEPAYFMVCVVYTDFSVLHTIYKTEGEAHDYIKSLSKYVEGKPPRLYAAIVPLTLSDDWMAIKAPAAWVKTQPVL